MGPDHHRVFMYAPDLSVSNQKDSPQRRTAVLSDVTDFLNHKFEVDIYYLARSGVDIIELGWNLSVEKPMLIFNLSKCSWFHRLRETIVWAALTPDEQKKRTERERKHTYSQTSRLVTPEELQLNRNHENSCF
jgi:hypothetical protein